LKDSFGKITYIVDRFNVTTIFLISCVMVKRILYLKTWVVNINNYITTFLLICVKGSKVFVIKDKTINDERIIKGRITTL